jgi:hypothetical protein
MWDIIKGAAGAIFGTSKKSGVISDFLKHNPWVGSAVKYGVERRDMNRAHQRQMADLRAAGINPILSAKLGGAQTPTMEGIGSVSNESRGHDYKETLTDAQIQEIASKIGVNEAHVEQLNEAANQLVQQARHTGAQADQQRVIADWAQKNITLYVANEMGLEVNDLKEIGKFLLVGGTQAEYDQFFDRLGDRKNQVTSAYSAAKQNIEKKVDGFKQWFYEKVGK